MGTLTTNKGFNKPTVNGDIDLWGSGLNGTIDQIPQMLTRRFKRMDVRRKLAAPIQMDGELVEAGPNVEIRLLPKALTVLVPDATTTGNKPARDTWFTRGLGLTPS